MMKEKPTIKESLGNLKQAWRELMKVISFKKYNKIEIEKIMKQVKKV